MKALVPRNVVSKNEVNPFTNKKVMSKVKVFVTDRLTDGQTDRLTDGQFKNMMPSFGGIKIYQIHLAPKVFQPLDSEV